MAAAFGSTTGLAFLLSAGVVAEFIAKDVSSPQTTELNAEKRAPTLMKWVHIGMVEAALFVTIAAIIDRQNRAAIIAGGLLSAVITEGQYLHARAAGLANLGTATEDW